VSKRNKGTHGIYDLTCISHKCSRRFKVIYDIRFKAAPYGSQNYGGPQLTYPFTGCPFCGAWWPTGPLDGEAYPKRPKDATVFDLIPPFEHDIGVLINRRQSRQ
jgi:hypothetical protein